MRELQAQKTIDHISAKGRVRFTGTNQYYSVDKAVGVDISTGDTVTVEIDKRGRIVKCRKHGTDHLSPAYKRNIHRAFEELEKKRLELENQRLTELLRLNLIDPETGESLEDIRFGSDDALEQIENDIALVDAEIRDWSMQLERHIQDQAERFESPELRPDAIALNKLRNGEHWIEEHTMAFEHAVEYWQGRYSISAQRAYDAIKTIMGEPMDYANHRDSYDARM